MPSSGSTRPPRPVDRLLRHAEDDAGRLVLRDRHGARPASSPAAPSAPSSPMPVRMTPTAFGAGGLRHRAEEHVDARAVAGDERAVADLDDVVRAAAPHEQHVRLPGAIERPARRGRGRRRPPPSPRSGSVWSSRSAKAAVKISGMCCTMTMPGRVGRHAPRAASRSASVPPVEAPTATTLSVVQPRRVRRAPAARRARRAVGRAPAPARGDAARRRGAPHGVDEQHRRLLEELAHAELRLRDRRRPRPPRAPAGRASVPGAAERRADDHRDRVLGHELAQEGEAVHARHLEVERRSRRAAARCILLQRDERVGGRRRPSMPARRGRGSPSAPGARPPSRRRPGTRSSRRRSSCAAALARRTAAPTGAGVDGRARRCARRRRCPRGSRRGRGRGRPSRREVPQRARSTTRALRRRRRSR